jgi:hypothetical protein
MLLRKVRVALARSLFALINTAALARYNRDDSRENGLNGLPSRDRLYHLTEVRR